MNYLEKVKKESTLDFEIVSYEENLDDGMIELLETNPEEAMSWWYDAFDNKLWFILPWQLIVLWWVTGCVDSDTEFLTPTWWKKISEYEEWDMVWEYNNWICEFKRPINYIKKEQEYWWRIKNKSIDMLLTEEHRVLYKTSRWIFNTKHLYEILDIYKNNNNYKWIYIPYSFDIKDNKWIDLTDDELRLMVAVIADWFFKKDTLTNWCRINIKKENKKNRLKYLLEKCWYDYEEVKINPSDLEYSTFKFYSPRKDKVFNEYYWWCNKHQLEIIYDEFVHWDWSIDKRNWHKKFHTTIKKSADFIQYVIHVTTWRKSSVNITNREWLLYWDKKQYTRISNDINVIEQWTNKWSTRITFKDFSQEKMPDWFKYCFTTSTTYWIARRNWYIFITWNTWKSTFANQVAQNIYNQWIKVWKFTLEDRHQDRKKQELYYEIGRIRKQMLLKNYPMNLFMINACEVDEKVLLRAKENLLRKNKNILDYKTGKIV